MSGAGDKLRAERARFEKELASPGVIPDPAIGADDARHFLADTPEAPADDSVWDDEGDDDPREEAPARPGPSTRAKVAMPTTPYLAATRDAAAAKPPPSPTLPTPSPDLTVNIRAALDAAEKGLRASVVARTEMERLAASRGAGRRPGGTAAFARPHAASPKTPVIGAAGETFSLATLPRPTDAQALASLGFENEDDPEAQAYLKGVLRMLYDEERAPEARSPGGTTPGAASGSGRLGDASERERVVSRRAHSRSPGSVASAASPAGAATTPAEDQKTTPETTVSSAKGSNPGGADGGERSDEGTAAGPSLTAASPLRGSFAFAARFPRRRRRKRTSWFFRRGRRRIRSASFDRLEELPSIDARVHRKYRRVQGGGAHCASRRRNRRACDRRALRVLRVRASRPSAGESRVCDGGARVTSRRRVDTQSI